MLSSIDEFQCFGRRCKFAEFFNSKREKRTRVTFVGSECWPTMRVIYACTSTCIARVPRSTSAREILWRGLSRVQIADLASSPLSMARRWSE